MNDEQRVILMEFAHKWLLNKCNEGYEYEDETMMVAMQINRVKKYPQHIRKMYDSTLLELKRTDIGCLSCAYRESLS